MRPLPYLQAHGTRCPTPRAPDLRCPRADGWRGGHRTNMTPGGQQGPHVGVAPTTRARPWSRNAEARISLADAEPPLTSTTSGASLAAAPGPSATLCSAAGSRPRTLKTVASPPSQRCAIWRPARQNHNLDVCATAPSLRLQRRIASPATAASLPSFVCVDPPLSGLATSSSSSNADGARPRCAARARGGRSQGASCAADA